MDEVVRERCAGALDRLVASEAAIRSAEAQQVRALAELAASYRVDMDAIVEHCAERTFRYAAEGTPEVSEFLNLEVGPALGLSEQAAGHLVVAALDLYHRHPRLFAALERGELRRWQADALTKLTGDLSAEGAEWVDVQVALVLGRIPFGRLKRLTEGLVAQADPALQARKEAEERARREVRFGDFRHGSAGVWGRLGAADAKALERTLDEMAHELGALGDERTHAERRAAAMGMLSDPHRAGELLGACPAGSFPPVTPRAPRPAAFRGRGRAVVHLHLHERTVVDPGRGVARVEGLGPLTAGTLPEFLRGLHVTVQPVVDGRETRPVDAYEVPTRLRDAVLRRFPVSVFPFAANVSRGLDLDHSRPYVHPGREGYRHGQTSMENLAPLTRRAHRAKTLGAWRLERIDAVHFAWTSPLGRRYDVGPEGTGPPRAPTARGAPIDRGSAPRR